MFSIIPTIPEGESRLIGIYWRAGGLVRSYRGKLAHYPSPKRLIIKMPILIGYGITYDVQNDLNTRGWWLLVAGFTKDADGLWWHAGRAPIGQHEVIHG